jgi:hypothetical protein
MKKFFTAAAMLILAVNSFASPAVDRKIGDFFSSLKKGDYSTGLEKLLKNTALEEKVLNVTQTKNNWINQFKQITSIYGDYLSYDKVFTKKLGKLEVSYYFVYCETYLIQFIVTEYDHDNKVDIINFVYDDKVLDTLDTYGAISN